MADKVRRYRLRQMRGDGCYLPACRRPGSFLSPAVSVFLLAAVVLMGCGEGTDTVETGGPGQDDPSTVYYQRIPPSLPIWRVEGVPILQLGSLGSPGPQLFGRIMGVSEGRDGVVLVAEGHSNELRAFDRDGRNLWTTGGEGDGPGEYRGIKSVFSFQGDSLLVVELVTPEATVLDSQGRFHRRITFERPRPGFSRPFVQGVLPGGKIVAFSEKEFRETGPEPGPRRAQASVALFDADGRFLTELGLYRAGESMIELIDGGFRVRRVTFGREMVLAVGGGKVAVSDQEEFHVDVYDSTGRLEMTLGVLSDPVLVNRAFRNRYINAGLASIPDAEARAERASRRRRSLLPDTLPAIGEVALDAHGRVWVEEFVPSFEHRLPVWWVFSPDGEFLAEAHFPRGFTPVQIENDHVLGISLDSLDVAWVELRGIVKGGD